MSKTADFVTTFQNLARLRTAAGHLQRQNIVVDIEADWTRCARFSRFNFNSKTVQLWQNSPHEKYGFKPAPWSVSS